MERDPRDDRVEEENDEEFDATFLRAENEDDDGYDPYSDRRAGREPLFEPDPWK